MRVEVPRRNSSESAVIEFISYDGKYPNRCSGTLVISINGRRIEMQRALSSGGVCSMLHVGDDRVEHVEEGNWYFNGATNLDEEVLLYEDVILQLVNEHVTHGCCGGCL